MKTFLISCALCFGILTSANAQLQVIKGRVLDADASYPLIGANVILQDSDPVIGAVTDAEGNFRMENIPVGRQSLIVQYVGYKPITLPNVLVTAGKEVILTINLKESVESLNEVVVKANSRKDLPLNDLAKVSARTFSIEEVNRFSGGRNDVARLATSFAGVSAANDSRNDIVVRGNSPVGLLWRVEGIPVPTTNHFSTFGTTGGPVSALNVNLLRTSDFLTGAFPAEYGNANAAVFDVNFRNGNPDKFEFTGQLSAFSGVEFMAEGPLLKKNGGSFVASYRYGIASLAATGTSATPFFQDFSAKVNLGETKIGRFELFGMWGLSSIDFFGNEIDENDLFADPTQDAFVSNQLSLVGITHKANLTKTAFLKTSFGVSTTYSEFVQDNLIKNANEEVVDKYRAVNNEDTETRYTITSTLNKKFNARWNLRAGVVHELYDLQSFTEDGDARPELDQNNDGKPDRLLTVRDVDDVYNLTQVFAQVENNVTDNLSFTFGLHSQYLDLSEKASLEPRTALSWKLRPNQTLSLAYGLHAQTVPGPVLFYSEQTAPGVFQRTNQNLDFMKSNQIVLAYDRTLGENWRLKSEIYYQSLFDIPVEQVASSYSVINEGAEFVFEERGSLVSEGTGTNFGLEVTLEKFFSKGYYVLMTGSLFESTYEGSDGIERSTAFNKNFVGNMLFGKEWKFGEGGKNALTFDTKFTTAGGNPFTPIDVEATRMNGGRQILMENDAFSDIYNDYLRWDAKFGVRFNSKKRNVSHQFFVDFQNVLNRENEFVRRYNEVTDQVNTVTQNGFFPDVLYRIQF